MKIISTLALISWSVLAFAQKPHSGTYVTHKKDIGFTSEVFQFHKDSTFSYIFFNCTGTEFGKGTYDIVNGNSLRLQFTSCLDCNDRHQVEHIVNSNDSLEIDLIVKEWVDSLEFSNVVTYITNTKIGTVTKENGQAKFTTAKSDKNRTLRIKTLGFDMVDLEIPPNTTSLKGTVYLSNHKIYNSTDIKTYKILKWTKSKLKLEKPIDWRIVYNKAKSDNVDRLIESKMNSTMWKLYVEKIGLRINDNKE